jgi:hypothetical protein
MAAGNTYVPISSTTLGGNGTITFTSIPSTYTDLRIIINGGITNFGWDFRWRFNSDAGTNYSEVSMTTDGSSSSTSRTTNATKITCALGQTNNTLNNITIVDVLSYASNKYKTCLIRSNNATSGASSVVGLWRSTSAINSIYIYCGASNDGQADLYAGTVVTLYGIAAA